MLVRSFLSIQDSHSMNIGTNERPIVARVALPGGGGTPHIDLRADKHIAL